jgi:PAS domain S-box-containing protein
MGTVSRQPLILVPTGDPAIFQAQHARTGYDHRPIFFAEQGGGSMALVKCRECMSNLSTEAPACQNCGTPVLAENRCDETREKEMGIAFDAARRRMEEEIKTILRTTIDGFYLVDTEGRILDANDAYCSMIGYSRDELRRIGVKGVEAIDTQEVIEARIRRILEKGSDRFETKHIRKDGRVIDVEASVNMMQGSGRLFVFMRDISERRRADEKLQKSERQLRSSQQIARLGSWDLDLITMKLDWSDQTFELFDQSPATFVPSFDEFARLVHPDDRSTMHAHFDRALAGDDDFPPTAVGIVNDSGRQWVLEVFGAVRRDGNGRPLSVYGTAQDITERKRMEAALRMSEKRYRAIVDQATDGIFIMDLQGKVLQVNPAFARSHGYTVDEMLRLGLDGIDVERTAPLPGRLARLLAGESLTFEVEHRRKDGSLLPLEVASVLVEFDDTKAIIAFHRDLSSRRRAEAENVRLETQLRQAQKMESVGRLAGGVAHDFNNMLTVILGQTELAIHALDPSNPLHNSLQEIQKAAQRSADLTSKLLAFARKQTVSPRVLDLNETVTGMLKMMQRLIGENIDLCWQPQPELWTVRMDPSQVDQILANLCVNAKDAISGVGKVTIEASNRTFGEDYCASHAEIVPGEYVLLAVSDDGCGMDTNTLSHIFEPFYTTKALGKGTGLGMATVHGIVKQNHGMIDVHSELGQGTTVLIYLPRTIESSGETPKPHLAEPAIRGRETILLVEDEPAILSLTTAILSGLGYAVVAARTPGEATRLAKEHAGRIQLLLTDVVMPEMDGRALAKNLLLLYPTLKCLFTSGYTADVIAHHGLLESGVHFISKPFSRSDLATKVREVLDGQ